MSAATKIITTLSGKKLEYRDNVPSDVLSLLELADFDPTPSWIKYALMIYSVEAIDGIPVDQPQTKEQIKQIGDALGVDGISALFDAMKPVPNPSANGDPETTKAKN